AARPVGAIESESFRESHLEMPMASSRVIRFTMGLHLWRRACAGVGAALCFAGALSWRKSARTVAHVATAYSLYRGALSAKCIHPLIEARIVRRARKFRLVSRWTVTFRPEPCGQRPPPQKSTQRVAGLSSA